MEVFNYILILGIIQGILFNAINFYNYKLDNKTVIFLNLFVLFLTINNLQAWLIEKDFHFSFYYLRYLQVPWYIVITPMFFLFLSNYLNYKKRTKIVLFVSIIIFFFSIIIRFFKLYMLKDEQNEIEFLASFKDYNTIEEIIGFAFTLILFAYSLKVFQKTLKSSNEILEFDNLNWLKIFFGLGLVIITFWLVAIILNTSLDLMNSSIIYSPLRVSTSILIYWLGYQGMYQQKFVGDRISIRKKLFQKKHNEKIPKTTSENVLKNETNKQKILFIEIQNYIKNERKFTDSQLSLEYLAKEFSISTSQLSPIINTYANKSFTDFINEFRIDLAKELLIDQEYYNYTVVTIGLESGFNSKTTFYNAFKKHTGLTPVAYKKKALK